jgi:hypothetical protein
MGSQRVINALNDYLAEVANKPFNWHLHDCFSFTNEAWRRMHGFGWADDWAGKYTENGLYMRRQRLREVFGFDDFVSAIDSKLDRAGKFPPRGALVSTTKRQRWVVGLSLGICTGQHAAFLGAQGTIYLSTADIEHSWVKR